MFAGIVSCSKSQSLCSIMESVVAFSDNSAIENFRQYLRIKTVQPMPAYGIIFVDCTHFLALKLLAICCPIDCTVASGIVGVAVVVIVVVGSQMRTIKCTCVIFDVSIGLDPS